MRKFKRYSVVALVLSAFVMAFSLNAVYSSNNYGLENSDVAEQVLTMQESCTVHIALELKNTPHEWHIANDTWGQSYLGDTYLKSSDMVSQFRPSFSDYGVEFVGLYWDKNYTMPYQSSLLKAGTEITLYALYVMIEAM